MALLVFKFYFSTRVFYDYHHFFIQLCKVPDVPFHIQEGDWYSNEAKRANLNIYDDFKLKKKTTSAL